ncbi:MAG: DUF1669 domain-containing protein [Lentisphaeria bacterium]|nr:DUF1669 domain-containing protein [Lentisphaeria bacterium]
MSRKTTSGGADPVKKAVERAVKGAAKSAVKSAAKKEVRKISRRIPLKYQLGALVLIVVIVAGAMFVPERYVPASLAKPHTALLTWRNRMILSSRLPFSFYDDTHLIPNPGTDPIQLYFAPSPKICPALCAFLRSARSSVDVCSFDIKLEPVADALIELRKRNIPVRIVTDTDYMKNEAIGRLSRAGIPIVSDRKNSLMHNKFIVVDSRYVWTGSYNLTDNGTWKNDNNALLIESPSVAAGYKARFEQYWSDHFSTSGKPTATPQNAFIGQLPVYYAFSPTDKIRDTIMAELSKARKSVDVMAFSFTGAELAAKLRELCGKGVRVRCLFDYGQSKNKASRDEYLQKIGAQVYYSPNRKGKMHHKVFIIDGRTVITGSYNFSKNAETKNDENILILYSERIAALYTEEMDRCIRGIKGY